MTTQTHAHPLFLTGRHPEFDAKGSRGFDNRRGGGTAAPSSGQHNRTHLKIKSSGNPNKGSERVRAFTLFNSVVTHIGHAYSLNYLDGKLSITERLRPHLSALKVLVENKLSTNLRGNMWAMKM